MAKKAPKKVVKKKPSRLVLWIYLIDIAIVTAVAYAAYRYFN